MSAPLLRVARFIEEMIHIMDQSGVSTFKQFAAAKFDDFEFQPYGIQGAKVFVRMAIKKLKAENGAFVCRGAQSLLRGCVSLCRQTW